MYSKQRAPPKKWEMREAQNGENGEEWKRRERDLGITGIVHTPER